MVPEACKSYKWYQEACKSYKWYRKLAIQLILQVVLNSDKVFQKYTGLNYVDYLKFFTDNIALLITASPMLNKQVTNDDTIQRLSGRYFHTKKAEAGALDGRASKPC